jgi:hypothetical protein
VKDLRSAKSLHDLLLLWAGGGWVGLFYRTATVQLSFRKTRKRMQQPILKLVIARDLAMQLG